MTNERSRVELALERRYAPGEDMRPLARAVGGGLLGALAALAIDRLLPWGAPNGWTWPALVAATFGDPERTGVGLTLFVAFSVVVAIVFTYGQFRRFVLGGPAVAGLVWSLGVWLAVAGAVLPQASAWPGAGGAAGAAGSGPAAPVSGAGIGPAVALVVETTLSVAVLGVIMGLSSPADRKRQ